MINIYDFRVRFSLSVKFFILSPVYNCFPFPQDGVFSLSNKEIQLLVESKTIPVHQLEKVLKDPVRAVKIRYLVFTTLCVLFLYTVY